MKRISILSLYLLSFIVNAQSYAIYTQDTSIGSGVNSLRFSNGSGFTQTEPSIAPYEGSKNYLLTYDGTSTYFQGVFFPRNNTNTADTSINLSAYSYYNLALKSSCPTPFYLRMRGNTIITKVLIDPSSNSYGFTDDNQWHFLSIPFLDFIPESSSFSLTTITEAFVLRSNDAAPIVKTIYNFDVDNIYVSTRKTIASNATGNWGTASTWSGGVIPSALDDVVIAKEHTVDITATGNTETTDLFTAQKVALELGPGFNLGNTFENGINLTTFVGVKPIIDLYKNAGMKHVRIPTTWMDRFTNNLADVNGNINFSNPRFIELVKVIDYAITQNMYVILNTHHEHWLKDHYNGSVIYDTKFKTLWTGIATYFKDYPKKLIFEVLNEPDGYLGEFDGTGPFPDPTDATALVYTRKVNKIGYNAIRTTGGNNTTRVIMVGINGQGNALYIDKVYPNKMSLPGVGTDNYLTIQVHTYNPWTFCGETGSNTAFPGTSFVETGIENVKTHALILNVPIHYGEFGVGRSSNTGERNTDIVRGFYRTIAKTTLSQSMSYSVWDDRGWFALINTTGTSFTNNIVPFMLQ